ncbi:metallophosphoesterase [Priestia abyssalis]|uniref:metallophosphoesterase n=1 Tax=Priestia abyssalis TaxID=1221450 RepID=UPI00099585C5|nr:metallophosphoesterase [Priestia abyssalis]
MRRFAISDIHGSYYEMMKLLEYVKFHPGQDQLVVVGDMINRGPESGKVVKELKELQETYKHIHVTIGNHEEMMLWYLAGVDDMWVHFGGKQAADSINEAFYEEGAGKAVQWVHRLPLTFEDEKFVYAHAGFLLPYKTERQNREHLWLQRKVFYSIQKEALLSETEGKITVHGHTPANTVIFDGARMGIDLGAQVTSGPKLALVELEEWVSYVYDFGSERIRVSKISKK